MSELSPLAALQATLAGEHAAVHLFAVIGAQTSRSAQPVLFHAVETAHDAHRLQRDRLTELVARTGGEPVAAEVSYELPNPLRTVAQLRSAATQVEARCADLCGQLVENSTGAVRAWAITALQSSAVRAIDLGGEPEDFPGFTAG